MPNVDQCRPMLINTNQFWSFLINANQCWSMINTHQFRSILINDQHWTATIDILRMFYWCIDSALIGTDQNLSAMIGIKRLGVLKYQNINAVWYILPKTLSPSFCQFPMILNTITLSSIEYIFAQKFLQHSVLYWWDGNVQIYEVMGVWVTWLLLQSNILSIFS